MDKRSLTLKRACYVILSPKGEGSYIFKAQRSPLRMTERYLKLKRACYVILSPKGEGSYMLKARDSTLRSGHIQMQKQVTI